jgi:transcriptional regulator with XRE-family HTH domain
MTQVQLAEEVGVSERWVREWETGRASNPSSERMKSLARVLEVPVGVLMRLAPGAAEASS